MAAFWKNFSLSTLNPFQRKGEFVALDIGSSSVKMVEATIEKNGFHLLNLGVLPLPSNAIQNNVVVEKEVAAKTIQTLIESNGVKATNVVSSLPGRAVIIKKIQMPARGEEEIEANVYFEATNVIPESLENVNLDYQILNYLGDGNEIEILLVAVKKDIVQSYTETIQGAGLTPAIMDVDYFALGNMYEISYEPKLDEVIGLIHVGARYTSINVIKNGISTFTGDLPVGGEAFTESLMQELQISYDQAETLKITGLLEGKRDVDLDSLLKRTCDSMTEEISRTLSLYGTMAGEEGIHGIYLSGGGARVPSLAPALGGQLGVPVQLSDPFRGFSVAKNIDRDFLNDSALTLAVGAGLAVRRLGDK